MSIPVVPAIAQPNVSLPISGAGDPIDTLRTTFNFAIANQTRIQATVVMSQARVDAAKDKAK